MRGLSSLLSLKIWVVLVSIFFIPQISYALQISVSVDKEVVNEGESAELSITYTPDFGPAGGDFDCSVQVLTSFPTSSANSNDFSTSGFESQLLGYSSFSIPQEQTVKAVFNTADDDLIEVDEEIIISIIFSSGVNSGNCPIVGDSEFTETITIKDNDFQEILLDVSMTVDNTNPSEDDSSIDVILDFKLPDGKSPDQFCDITAALRVVGTESTATNSDYTFNPPSNIRFGGGAESGSQESFSVPLQIIDDTLVEEQETIIIEATIQSNGSGGLNSCPLATSDILRIQVNLNDNDFEEVPLDVSLTVDNKNPSENDSSINVKVDFKLPGSNTPDQFCDTTATLRFVDSVSTASSNDFTFRPPITIRFGSGVDSGNTESFSIPLQIIDDALVEQQETIIIEATFHSNGGADGFNSCPLTTTAPQRITINLDDNDFNIAPLDVSLTVDNETPSENIANVNVNVGFKLEGSAVPDQLCEASVSLRVIGSSTSGSATNNVDYTFSPPLDIKFGGRFGSGNQETISVPLHIINDQLVEPPEEIIIEAIFDSVGVNGNNSCPFSNATGGSVVAIKTVTITLEDDVGEGVNPVDVSFSVKDSTLAEGQLGSLIVKYKAENIFDDTACSIIGKLNLLTQSGRNIATEGVDFITDPVPNLDFTAEANFVDEKQIIIPIQILDDELFEGDETLTYQMSFTSNNPLCPIKGNAVQSQVIVIKDNDVQEFPLEVSLTVDDSNPVEKNSTVNLTVGFKLEGNTIPNNLCNASATLRILDTESTATSGDYTFTPPANIHYGGQFQSANQETFSVPLQIINDSLVEQPETITIEATFQSNDINGNNSCPLTTSPANNVILVRKVVVTIRDDINEGLNRSITEVVTDACNNLKPDLENGSVEEKVTFDGQSQGQKSLSDICKGEITNKVIRDFEPEEVFAIGTAIIETSRMQLTNINSRLIALRRGGTRRLDGSGINMRINGEAIPNVIFEGSGGEVFETGGSSTDPLPDSVFQKGSSGGSVHEEQNGAYKSSGGGGGSGDEPNDLLAMSRWGFFANGEFLFGEKDESTGERGFDFDSRGLTIGADYRMPGEKLIIGGSLGYNDYDSAFTSEIGSMNLRGFHVSTYGTYLLSDKTYLDAIMSLGRNKIDIQRPTAFAQGQLPVGSPQPVAIGRPDSNDLSVSVGGGYEWSRKKLTLSPFARLDYTRSVVDAYTEAPSHPSALGSMLAIDKQNLDSMATAVGARATYAISTSKGVFLPQASIEWRHQFENNSRDIGAQLIFDPNQSGFTVTSEKPDRDYLNIGLGVSAVFPKGRSGFVFIESRQGHNRITETAIKVGIRIEF